MIYSFYRHLPDACSFLCMRIPGKSTTRNDSFRRGNNIGKMEKKTTLSKELAAATGALENKLTNDMMFHMVMSRSERALKNPLSETPMPNRGICVCD